MDVLTESQKRDLYSYIMEIEKLENERIVLQNSFKDILQAAKTTGFDIKIIKQIVKMRKIDKDKREREESILHLYMHAIGMDIS